MEIVDLRRAFKELKGLGRTGSRTIDNLKRIVPLGFAELEAAVEKPSARPGPSEFHRSPGNSHAFDSKGL